MADIINISDYFLSDEFDFTASNNYPTYRSMSQTELDPDQESIKQSRIFTISLLHLANLKINIVISK